ncbi:transmembrane protein 65-like [Centruroides sculpturatus]|uniref:transmembrane protein 65-like n=1 Tax=Centruroides sculpturatus TaxID=218467 RepID=UPI000C6EE31C|nr:transmembrane protein 65-like [Centruroides sculpturatus]
MASRIWRARTVVERCLARVSNRRVHTRRVDTIATQKAAKDFVFLLSPDERTILLEELDNFQKAAKQEQAPVYPTTKQLQAVAIHNAIPFIGFGFLDNFIMIVAGDYIDATIGITLGISTMAAAGLGNALSDVCGIGSAWYVERLATKVGVQAPSLTPLQVDMPRTRWSANMGRALGVTVGCILGMVPLLFLKEKKTVQEEEVKKG